MAKRGRRKSYSRETKKSFQKLFKQGRKRKSKKNKLYVYLTCKKCGQKFWVRTNNKELYTDKIKANWVCVICK